MGPCNVFVKQTKSLDSVFVSSCLLIYGLMVDTVGTFFKVIKFKQTFEATNSQMPKLCSQPGDKTIFRFPPSPPLSPPSPLFAIPFTMKTPCILQQDMPFTRFAALNTEATATIMFFPSWNERMTATHRFAVNFHTCANFWLYTIKPTPVWPF